MQILKLAIHTNRNNRNKLSKNFTTDTLGKFYFAKDDSNYNNVEVTVKTNGETGLFGNSYINREYKPQENTNTVYNTFLFTDRSIYRPGQTVYFKGIVTKTENRKTKIANGEK